MAAGATINPAEWLNKQLEQASPDLLREMLATFVVQVMGVEVDGICAAGYGSNRRRDRLSLRPHLRPLCHGRNRLWLLSQGHAAARPVLVAVAWQPSAVACV